MTGRYTDGLRYLDVCSGISAPTMAWKPLGWQALCFAEIEAAPRAVLAHHYPDVPLVGDFTQIRGDEYGPVDLLVGGTPCQSFSIAGLRGGLDDERGNLALEYLRLAGRARPRWVVWENVPGVFSSLSHAAPNPRPPEIDLDAGDGPEDGEEIVVEDSYEADESHALGCFLAGLSELGYGWAYRVFDAQYAGVPQRRRRIFVVGYLGDWRRPAAVLFERHGLSGHPAPRREKGQNAPTIPSGSSAGGGLGADFDCDGGLIASTGDISHCLNAGGMGRQDYETETLIAHSLRGEGFDASEDGTGRGTPIVPVAFSIMPMNSGKDYKARETDVAQPLMAGGPVGGNQGGDFIAQPVAFAIQERAVSEDLDQGPQGKGYQPDIAYTLEARNKVQSVAASAVRRLTPRECERLQGFPDDFTLTPYRKGMMADGPRYKMLGNSMAVPVIRWIGERIQAVEALSERSLAA